MTDTAPLGSRLRDAFRMDTGRGRLALATAVLMLLSPALATFVSPWFLVLLALALVLSFAGLVSTSAGTRSLARAGYAMAVNGVLLIVGLFIAGFVGDFVVSSRGGLQVAAVGVGFTTVHIMLAVGLLIVDDQRHAQRPDI